MGCVAARDRMPYNDSRIQAVQQRVAAACAPPPEQTVNVRCWFSKFLGCGRSGARLSVLTCGLLAASAGARAAQDPPPQTDGQEKFLEKPKPLLEFRIHAGFEFKRSSSANVARRATHRAYHWVPIIVECINRTRIYDPRSGRRGRTIEGDLVITASRKIGQGQHHVRLDWTYRRSIIMPPQTRKRYVLRVYPWEWSGSELQLQVRQGGRALMPSERIALFTAKRDRLLLVVTDAASANAEQQRRYYGFLRRGARKAEDFYLGAPPDIEGIMPAIISTEMLPESWMDLMSVDAVLIDGPPNKPLSERQREALQGYVDAGGHLIVMGGRGPDALRAFGLYELVGLRFAPRPQRRHDLPALRPCGGPFPANPVPLSIPVIRLAAGNKNEKENENENGYRIVFGEPDLPLVVRRAQGLGRVTFCALNLNDHGIAEWDGRLPLIEFLLERKVDFPYARRGEAVQVWMPPVTPNPRGELRSSISAELEETSVVMPMPRRWVATFLIIYMIALVPANFFLFNRLQRRELAWAVTPLLAFGFAGYAYFAGVVGRMGTLTVNAVSIVQAGPRASQGRSVTFMSLNSPATARYDLAFPEIEPFVNHLEPPLASIQRGDRARKLVIDQDEGEGMTVRGLKVRSRSMSLLEVEALVPLNAEQTPLAAKLEVVTSGNTKQLRWLVHNPTEHRLIGCLLAYNGRAHLLGTLAPGERRTVKIDFQDMVNDRKLVLNRSVASIKGEFQKKMAEHVAKFMYGKLGQGAYIIGWVERSLLAVDVDGRRTPGPGLTAFVFACAVDQPRATPSLGPKDWNIERDKSQETGHWTNTRWHGKRRQRKQEEGWGSGHTLHVRDAMRMTETKTLVLKYTPNKDAHELLPGKVTLRMRVMMHWKNPRSQGKVRIACKFYDRIAGTWFQPGATWEVPNGSGWLELPPVIINAGCLRYVNPRTGEVKVRFDVEFPENAGDPLSLIIENPSLTVEPLR